MTEKDVIEKIEKENLLGGGYEPLAVSLMTVFLWAFFLSVGYEYFM